jgi:hypothetical protein
MFKEEPGSIDFFGGISLLGRFLGNGSQFDGEIGGTSVHLFQQMNCSTSTTPQEFSDLPFWIASLENLNADGGNHGEQQQSGSLRMPYGIIIAVIFSVLEYLLQRISESRLDPCLAWLLVL